MATGNKGSRRKAPAAATASIPAARATAKPKVMTAAEAAPALEAAHAAADVVLPPVVDPEAIVVEAVPVQDAPAQNAADETPAPISEEAASNPEPDPAPAAAPAIPTTTLTAEDSIMDATTTTQTAATDMAQKGQAMFAEANERAKGAMEKGAQFFAELTEFNKGNVEALVESSKIAARGFESMGQDAAAFARSSWEHGSAAMRTLATAKSPTEFLKLQAEFAREAFDTAVAQGSRSTEASLKLAGEIAQPISNRVALAAEKIKVAA